MSFPFDFLDSIFGGSGGSGGGFTSTQGGARLDQGFSSVAGWMVGQAFADAGPLGQYMGMLYGSPGTGIPSVNWGTDYGNQVDYGEHADFGQARALADEPHDAGGGSLADSDNATPSQSADSRMLEVLDREDGHSPKGSAPSTIEEVHVFGSPPDRPRILVWADKYLSAQRDGSFRGQELQPRWDLPPLKPPSRSRRPAARKPSSTDAATAAPDQLRPERDEADNGPYFNVESAPKTAAGANLANNPWMSDLATPEQFLPFGAWDRPENAPAPRLERGDTGRIEMVPTVPIERTFWSRGGTGLTIGAASLAVGLVVLFWWNPVGWVAGASLALAIAAGAAASTASAVQLGASYGGDSSPQQDADMSRAVSAMLAFGSVGGVVGSVIGTVAADDPQAGFETGGLVGGLGEGAFGLATALPGALRALPGLRSAALPWGKSLLLTPIWFAMSAGGGGGRARTLARLFAVQGRAASRVRSVQYLGTTPLLEREADWARFQIAATGSRNEGVFRITYANGEQKIVLADRFKPRSQTILEAKYGDMGQMFNPTRETHIIGQANNYIDIATATGGRVGYLVSTERGAARLMQRFKGEFPEQMASGQLWIDWVPWRR